MHTQLSPETAQKCVQETKWKSIVGDNWSKCAYAGGGEGRGGAKEEADEAEEEHVRCCCGDALKLNDNGYDGPLSLVYVIPSLARIVFHCTIVRELN